MTSNNRTWHIVTSQGRVVLGVFGFANLRMAEDRAREIAQEVKCYCWVETSRCVKPSVGEFLP